MKSFREIIIYSKYIIMGFSTSKIKKPVKAEIRIKHDIDTKKTSETKCVIPKDITRKIGLSIGLLGILGMGRGR